MRIMLVEGNLKVSRPFFGDTALKELCYLVNKAGVSLLNGRQDTEQGIHFLSNGVQLWTD